MLICIIPLQVVEDEEEGQAGTTLPLLGALEPGTSAEEQLLQDDAFRLYRNTGDGP